MLKLGNEIRFTEAEIEEARKLGIDLTDVKSEAQYSAAVVRLVETLANDRPELLERIAKELSRVTGHKLPAKLKVVK
jgi:hypothetical protein